MEIHIAPVHVVALGMVAVAAFCFGFLRGRNVFLGVLGPLLLVFGAVGTEAINAVLDINQAVKATRIEVLEKRIDELPEEWRGLAKLLNRSADNGPMQMIAIRKFAEQDSMPSISIYDFNFLNRFSNTDSFILGCRYYVFSCKRGVTKWTFI